MKGRKVWTYVFSLFAVVDQNHGYNPQVLHFHAAKPVLRSPPSNRQHSVDEFPL